MWTRCVSRFAECRNCGSLHLIMQVILVHFLWPHRTITPLLTSLSAVTQVGRTWPTQPKWVAGWPHRTITPLLTYLNAVPQVGRAWPTQPKWVAGCVPGPLHHYFYTETSLEQQTNRKGSKQAASKTKQQEQQQQLKQTRTNIQNKALMKR